MILLFRFSDISFCTYCVDLVFKDSPVGLDILSSPHRVGSPQRTLKKKFVSGCFCDCELALNLTTFFIVASFRKSFILASFSDTKFLRTNVAHIID